MQKVLIIGCSGAGKSTLARGLSERTGLPLIHLDQHYWRPGWVALEEDDWVAALADLTQGARWIIDGNYTRTLPLRIAAADTVVFFDFPAWRCLWRVSRRAVQWFGRTRHDMTPGCPERLTPAFLHYVARYNRDQRPRVLAALDTFGGRLVVLKTPAQAAAFLDAAAPRAVPQPSPALSLAPLRKEHPPSSSL